MKDGYCQKKCSEEKYYWSGRDGNQCLECQKVDKKCVKCANVTGDCLDCSDGYWPMDKTCEVGCKAQGEYWSKESKSCQECFSDCFRCQNITGRCLECKNELKVYQNGDICWYGEEALTSLENEDTPELIDGYFDPETTSLVLVFDKEVNEINIPKKLLSLKIELIEKTGESRLKINSTKYEGNLKIDFFEFPNEEVVDGSLRITTLVQGIVERLTNQTKDDSNEGGKRILAGENDHKTFKKLSAKKNIIKRNRIIEEEDQEEQKEGNSTKSPFFTLSIKKINYYNPVNTQDITTFGELIAWISLGLSLLLLLVYPPGALSLIQLTQAVSLLRILNTDLPTNLTFFMKEMSLSMLTLIPNPFKSRKSVSACKLNRVFYRIDHLTCNTLEGPIPVIAAQLMLLITLKKVLRWLLVYSVKTNFKDEKIDPKSLTKNQKKKIGDNAKIRVLVKINMIISRRFILYYLLAAQMDVMLPSLVGIISYVGQKHHQSVISLGISVLSSVGYLFFFCWIGNSYLQETKKKRRNLMEYRKKKAEGKIFKTYCFGEFKDKETKPLLVHSSSLALYGLFVAVLVVWSEKSVAQFYLSLVILLC